jgi:hypothetical protein
MGAPSCDEMRLAAFASIESQVLAEHLHFSGFSARDIGGQRNGMPKLPKQFAHGSFAGDLREKLESIGPSLDSRVHCYFLT